MCGTWQPANHYPRGGALVALSLPRSCSSEVPAAAATEMAGHLIFHTPKRPDAKEATHARLVFDFDVDAGSSSAVTKDYNVVIHTAGDLTQDAKDCGLFRRLRLAATAVRNEDKLLQPPPPPPPYMEWSLPQPLSLHVGRDGIIGRRVSVYLDDGTKGACGLSVPVAEGIIGFNS